MAVAYDTHASNTAGSGTTIDVTLTVASNSNRLAVVMISAESTSVAISGVAYTAGSGGTWTKLGGHVSAPKATEIWYSTAPSVGSITVRVTSGVTINNAYAVTLYSLYDADQTTPMDGYVSGGNVNSLTVTSAVGDLGLFCGIFTSGVTVTPGTTDYSASPWNFVRVNRADGAASIVFDYTDGQARSVSGGNVNAAAAASSFSKLAGSTASLASASGLAG